MYHCISADPPWLERGGGKCKRGADRHYPLLATPEIVRVMLSAPCWQPAADCHLWLWVTNNFLEDGLFVMRALGFRYVTNLAWGKVKERDQGDLFVQQGLGQYLRGSHELCLFGVRGRQPALARTQSSFLLLHERTEHSVKPAEAYQRMETISPGPRLEIFSRDARAGWDGWGGKACEVCNDDIPRDAPCPACDGKGVIHHYTQGRRDE